MPLLLPLSESAPRGLIVSSNVELAQEYMTHANQQLASATEKPHNISLAFIDTLHYEGGDSLMYIHQYAAGGPPHELQRDRKQLRQVLAGYDAIFLVEHVRSTRCTFTCPHTCVQTWCKWCVQKWRLFFLFSTLWLFWWHTAIAGAVVHGGVAEKPDAGWCRNMFLGGFCCCICTVPFHAGGLQAFEWDSP